MSPMPALPIVDSTTADLADAISHVEEPYVGYSYSYPHKSAYGPFDPPVPLAPVWSAERRDALFLYFHIPFCEMRCGFCNLFARAGGDESLLDAYLDALERQARAVGAMTVGSRRIARMAVGGGTPTYLSARQLHRLFDMAEKHFDARPADAPTSVETSPKTASEERLAVLHARGVQRVSLGVQSFRDDESHAIGRPQASNEVADALDRLRRFPILNIDLMYGLPGQDIASWRRSLRRALLWSPEELFLYPLYVRPETGLGRHANRRLSAENMNSQYREARDLLTGLGYEQVSMRFFRKRRADLPAAPVYCCQTDAMVGLGCGARSYTSGLHYSSRFAVAPADVRSILAEWIEREDFSRATWGCRVSDDDRQRRFVLQSLLTAEGLNEAEFERLFDRHAIDAIPTIDSLIDQRLARRTDGIIRLTENGMECSDIIGPSLYSNANIAKFRRFTRP